MGLATAISYPKKWEMNRRESNTAQQGDEADTGIREIWVLPPSRSMICLRILKSFTWYYFGP